MQEGAAPDVARLSDEAETEMTFALAGTEGARAAALRAYLRARGVAGGCLAIVGWEGDAVAVRARREATLAVLRRHGAAGLGAAPGRAWERGRFHGPYLRDALLEHGVLVDTLETAATWSDVPGVHRAVTAALGAHAPVVGCHVSHLYPTGRVAVLHLPRAPRRRRRARASGARPRPPPRRRCWPRAGRSPTTTPSGATTRRGSTRELGATGVAALRAVKRELDPAGILNPGKLGL